MLASEYVVNQTWDKICPASDVGYGELAIGRKEQDGITFFGLMILMRFS